MKKILICLGLSAVSLSIIAQNSFSVKDAYCIDMELGRVREDTNRFYMQDCFPNICHRYFYFTVDIELGYLNRNVVNDSIILSDMTQEKDKYVTDSIFFICIANHADTLFLKPCYFLHNDTLLTVGLYSLFPEHLLPYNRKELIDDVMKNYSTLKKELNNSLSLIYRSPITNEYYTLKVPDIRIPVYEDEKKSFISILSNMF